MLRARLARIPFASGGNRSTHRHLVVVVVVDPERHDHDPSTSLAEGRHGAAQFAQIDAGFWAACVIEAMLRVC